MSCSRWTSKHTWPRERNSMAKNGARAATATSTRNPKPTTRDIPMRRLRVIIPAAILSASPPLAAAARAESWRSVTDPTVLGQRTLWHAAGISTTAAVITLLACLLLTAAPACAGGWVGPGAPGRYASQFVSQIALGG